MDCSLFAEIFGDEWVNLTPAQRGLVGNDYHLAVFEDGCTLSEYQRRIGTGNLASYVACLRAGELACCPASADECDCGLDD